jgi:hypothetical protein
LGFTCTVCGRFHEEELRDVRAGLPQAIYELAPEEREQRATIAPGGDFASLDDDRQFVRALVEIPMPAEGDRFAWGVWVRLTPEDLADVAERWVDEASAGRTYSGWLATDLSEYGPTVELPGTLRLQSAASLPLFEIDVTTHPLAIEQRGGISLERARELAEPYRQA